MPVRRRPNGSWLIDLTVNACRYRKTLPAALRKRDVEAVERRWRTDLEQPAHRHAAATVGDIIQRYWTEKACHLADAAGQDRMLGLWGEALGPETPIARVQSDHISAILARWRNDVGDTTVNRRMAALRACWRWASDVWGVPLASVPWRTMRLAEPEPNDRSIAVGDRERLIAAWPARSRDVARLAFATGLRLSAVLGLRAQDIDQGRNLIRAVGKGRAGGKENLVPITVEVRTILDGLTVPDVGRLFTMSRFDVARDRLAARKEAGLPNFRLHDARHSFAQDLEDAGLGHFITDALHHSSSTLRRRYAHARQDVIREAIEEAKRRQDAKRKS